LSPLAAAGYRVLVPYPRGCGPTRFLDPAAARMARQAAVAQDLIDFMDSWASTAPLTLLSCYSC
jgi:pimeloyl-ACP methyl ester carboxylesterase